MRCAARRAFFVAAVVPVVPALVAQYTPESIRARRFAWLGAMSLLGFLFGPGLNAAAERLVGLGFLSVLVQGSSTTLVIALSAALGALMMLGLAATLPAPSSLGEADAADHDGAPRSRSLALWILNGVVMFVLAGFELGIVLQGQRHPDLSSREVSLMFAECSLVMLGVNAVLFFTGLLERADPRRVLACGMVLGIAGLLMLAPPWQRDVAVRRREFHGCGHGSCAPHPGLPRCRHLGAAARYSDGRARRGSRPRTNTGIGRHRMAIRRCDAEHLCVAVDSTGRHTRAAAHSAALVASQPRPGERFTVPHFSHFHGNRTMRLILMSLLAALALSLSGCGYNDFQRLDEQTKSAWSEVLNQYQRRADLIPNIVATVKGETNFEQETLTRVVEARAKATSIQATPELVNNPEAFQKFQAAQGELSGALSRLLVVSENYPQLKANQAFQDLRAQLEGTENRITVARGRYVKAVQDYNVLTRSFPTNITAKLFSYDVKPNFSVADEKAMAAPPQVDFGASAPAARP
ncbi:LemA family protein [Pseudomonas aeruginosa]|nr:LemA family protein [Pseudomonas aeruginosa]